MHSRIRAYGVTLAALLALAVALPVGLSARPKPGVTTAGSFRLFGRSLGAATVNRIYCGLLSSGKICADSTNSSTIPGGFWPKGTGNQYVFNSGMQFGGVIAPKSVGTGAGDLFSWINDTTGAFFFDARGDLSHGQEVQPIYNSQNSADLASWPDAAKVPQDDRGSSTYFSLLQGKDAASQGDIWFLTWDGDPAFSAGRKHPLGVLVETRIMGWNYPAGNNDILYLDYTFYNISSTCPADYNGVRPSMQSILLQQAAVFQAKNNAAFGITMPACGYDISKFYANFAADMDVTPDAGKNYASVNIPYQLGYIYSSYFAQNSSTTGYPPDITGPPFMGGYGFVGVKYLASPDSGVAPNQAPAGLSLFSDTENGGVFGDPANAIQLYRYMSGTVTPALGDGQCNHDPVTTHICHVEVSAPNDMRFFQSSGPFNLGAGQSGSVVVAYIFASPVKYGPCQTAASGAGIGTCGNLNPGNPEFLENVADLSANNVNTVDHLTGFVGYAAGAETSPVQNHFIVTPGSLLGKANIAQLVFDNKFLLPFAPASPEFFLVPGDNQVAVMWRPSSTEVSGDLYYQIAHSPVTLDVNGNPTAIPNPLYDPNYRKFDVEGYRVYRGRNQGDLHLLAQFDYAGTEIDDYNGQIDPDPSCAPELGIGSSGPNDHTCGGTYSPITPGVAQTKYVAHPLVGGIVQVVLTSGRVALANGTVLVTVADTAVTGTASGKFPPLADTGIPFTYVDHGALNNLRYFYAVTAFDLNSLQSGPSSLESPRNPKTAIPQRAASNYSSTYTQSPAVLEGRGVDLSTHVTAAPTLDATTGEFSGPAQATTNWSLGLAGAVISQVLQGPVALSAQFDSVVLGQAASGTPAAYWFSASGTPFAISLTQNFTEGAVSGNTPFLGPAVNAHQSAFYGGDASFKLGGQVSTGMVGLYQTLAFGRGCINGATGFAVAGATGCDFNGARWFNGPSPANNEATANPTAGNGPNGGAAVAASFSNAGSLTGVVHAYEPRSYQTMENFWRNVEGVLGGAAHAADYNLYWGSGGTIDSVIDYTYNVPLPFDSTAGATWGVLNAAALPGGAVRTTLFACVDPLKARPDASGEMGACPSVPAIKLSQTVTPGPVVFNTGGSGGWAAQTAQPNNGFGLYIAGHIFQFELAGGAVPAAGTVWTLRTYIGAIDGGTDGGARNFGPYVFTPFASPLNAPGAVLSTTITANNVIKPTVSGDLSEVHTVPDPYYVTDGFEVSPTSKVIKFVNLPKQCTIRIYSTSGVLVRILDHLSTGGNAGSQDWDVRNRNNQVVASGVYFYSIESATGPRVVKRLTIVNFSQ